MLSTIVTDFMHRHFRQTPRVIVGLSGGADSVALLVSMREANIDCIAAHCNFHLRGADSDSDQAYCEQLCQQLSVELVVKDFNVAKQMSANNESVEMACRTLRYAWWHQLIADGKGEYISVGHHCEDNVETMLLNLMRGCGINGVKGMLPVNSTIIRPLLEVSRKDIESYVMSKGYSWVSDRTNFENEFKRNRLRNIVLPTIENEFPGSTRALVRSLSILRDNYTLYHKLVDSRASQYILNDGTIKIQALIHNEPEPLVMLHEILPSYGLKHAQIDDIFMCIISDGDNNAGKLFLTAGKSYILEKGELSTLEVPPSHDKPIVVDFTNGPFTVSHLTLSEFNQLKSSGSLNNTELYIDASAMDGKHSWTIRTWRQGDRMVPFGMRGSRLVSDIFNDLKCPRQQRLTTPLLFCDNTLIWIVGLRTSNHYRVTQATTEVIKISSNI